MSLYIRGRLLAEVSATLGHSLLCTMLGIYSHAFVRSSFETLTRQDEELPLALVRWRLLSALVLV
jgi:hypothetical protein